MDSSFIIKEFDKNGLILRPQSLIKIQSHLSGILSKSNAIDDLYSQLDQLIGNLKQIVKNSNIIEPEQIQSAIDFIRLPSAKMEVEQIMSSQMSDIDLILSQKIAHSIVILNSMADIPAYQIH